MCSQFTGKERDAETGPDYFGARCVRYTLNRKARPKLNTQRNRGGRPRRQIDTAELLRLRQEGSSWREISRKMGLGKGTVCRAYQAATEALRVSENPLANETCKPVSVSDFDLPLGLRIRLCLLRVRLERERLQRFLAPRPPERRAEGILLGVEET